MIFLFYHCSLSRFEQKIFSLVCKLKACELEITSHFSILQKYFSYVSFRNQPKVKKSKKTIPLDTPGGQQHQVIRKALVTESTSSFDSHDANQSAVLENLWSSTFPNETFPGRVNNQWQERFGF